MIVASVSAVCHGSFVNWYYFDMRETFASAYGTKGQWLQPQLSENTCFLQSRLQRRMEPCVASSRVFLALTDINMFLLSLVEKFALDQAWCLISKNFSRLAEAIGGKQSLVVLDFCKVAFSLKFFFFLINTVCYKDAYHRVPKEKGMVIIFCSILFS